MNRIALLQNSIARTEHDAPLAEKHGQQEIADFIRRMHDREVIELHFLQTVGIECDSNEQLSRAYDKWSKQNLLRYPISYEAPETEACVYFRAKRDVYTASHAWGEGIQFMHFYGLISFRCNVDRKWSTKEYPATREGYRALMQEVRTRKLDLGNRS